MPPHQYRKLEQTLSRKYGSQAVARLVKKINYNYQNNKTLVRVSTTDQKTKGFVIVWNFQEKKRNSNYRKYFQIRLKGATTKILRYGNKKKIFLFETLSRYLTSRSVWRWPMVRNEKNCAVWNGSGRMSNWRPSRLLESWWNFRGQTVFENRDSGTMWKWETNTSGTRQGRVGGLLQSSILRISFRNFHSKHTPYPPGSRERFGNCKKPWEFWLG